MNEPGKPHVIVGTAGHIDHGKSSLVKALTGTDPDTLPEEKARGMTIELGFVFLDDPAYDRQVVFIDVPGHEKFVRTMAAGASSIDAALLVVAADEGIAVQTREHFDILQLLGLRHGIVTLTKADLVDDARLRELEGAVRAFVKGTFLEGAPVIPTSAATGRGLGELRAALREVGRTVEPRPDNGVFRMPIDRVFTMHGFGTVVAGTVLSGRVAVGDRVMVYPEGAVSRVRGVQVHRQKAERSGVGRRTALNLQDVKKEDLRRGQVAAAEGSLVPTIRLDVEVRVLRDAPREVKQRERVRVHIGTDEVLARMVILASPSIPPGGTGFAQLILERATTALPGDRFVLRSFSPLVTIAGGSVLDAAPGRHKRFDPALVEGLRRLSGPVDDAVAQRYLQSAGKPLDPREVAAALGRPEGEITAATERLAAAGTLVAIGAERPARYLHASCYAARRDDVLAFVKRYFEANPHLLLLPFSDLRSDFLRRGDAAVLKALMDELAASGTLVRRDAQVGLAGREVRLKPREQETMDRVERAFRDAGYASPLEDDVRRRLELPPVLFKNILDSLVQRGAIVRLAEKVTYHREALDAARAAVVELAKRRGSVTIAELRDRLHLSRKYAQAILEHFDRTGVTRRVEDRHELAPTGR